MNIRFIAPGIHVRNISRADFTAIGIPNQGSVSIDVRVNPVVDVEEAAGRWLLEHEAGQWEEVVETQPPDLAPADVTDLGRTRIKADQ